MTSLELIILIVFAIAVVVGTVSWLAFGIHLEIRDRKIRFSAHRRDRTRRHPTGRGGHAGPAGTA